MPLSVLAQSVAGAAGAVAGLDAVVVTATRAPSRIDATIGEVTVIDRERIEQATGRTLAELLAQEPGVQAWGTGGFGKTSAVSLRGLEARHTLLLVDGVRYGSVTVGIPIWDNLPLDAIERIEIVRGPLSGLYGSDAVGGVVQVFTRKGSAGVDGVRLDATAGVGSNAFRQGGAGVRFGAGAFDGAVQLQHQSTRGFSATNLNEPFGLYDPDDDGFRQNAASAQLGWRVGGWRVDGRVLESRGETRLDDGPGADARAKLRTAVQSLQVAGKPAGEWATTVRLARSVDRYDTIATASPWTPLGATTSTQTQLGWENTLPTALGRLVLIGEHLRQVVDNPSGPYDRSRRTIDGVAAGLDGKRAAHAWQANLRHDRNSQFGSETTGSLGYGYDVAAGWRAAASYGTSFVAPSFNQLYFPFFGNPDLLPERGRQAELSLRWTDGVQQARVAVFDTRIRGFITPGPNPGNVDARIDGVSASWRATLDRWTLALSGERLDPRNDTQGANLDKQLPRRAKALGRVQADYAVGAWSAGLTLQAAGGRYEDAANTYRMGGYATVDLRAGWRFARGWSLDLRVNNLADRTYETARGYNSAGREGFVTLRYTMG